MFIVSIVVRSFISYNGETSTLFYSKSCFFTV